MHCMNSSYLKSAKMTENNNQNQQKDASSVTIVDWFSPRRNQTTKQQWNFSYSKPLELLVQQKIKVISP